MKTRVPLLMTVALAACSVSQTAPSPATAPAASPWRRVTVAEPAEPIDAPARVVAGAGATTWATVPLRATVLRVHARLGDPVDAGTVLMEVVMPELLDAAGRAEGARARLQALWPQWRVR